MRERRRILQQLDQLQGVWLVAFKPCPFTSYSLLYSHYSFLRLPAGSSDVPIRVYTSTTADVCYVRVKCGKSTVRLSLVGVPRNQGSRLPVCGLTPTTHGT